MVRSRPAFARRDFLAAVLLVLVLSGVAVSSIQHVREAASRGVCQEHLRKLGAAVLAYEQTQGHIPPSALDAAGTRRGWVTFVLPELGHEKLAREFRTDADWFHPDNAPVVATPLDSLRCPAAPGRAFSSGTTDGVSWRGAVGDYAAVEGLDGSVFATGTLVPPNLDGAGLFRDREATRLDSAVDGRATILMLVENAGRPQAWRKGQRQRVDLTEEEGVWASRQFKMQPRGHTPDGTGFPGPCAVNCSNYRGVYAFHPGAAHACFADGSVRPLRDALSIHVFYAMVTIRGGEILSPND